MYKEETLFLMPLPRPVSDSWQGDHLPLFLPSTQVSFRCLDFTFVWQRIITIACRLFYMFSLNTKLRVAVSLFDWRNRKWIPNFDWNT